MMMMRLPPILAISAVLCATPASLAQSLKPEEILSSIAVRPISEPNPVLGADGRTHLAYELMVDNPSKLFITLDKVEAVSDDGRSLWSLEGSALADMTSFYSGADKTLPPGGSAAIFMDVSFGPGEQRPGKVSARITITRQLAGPDGKPAPMPADSPVPATVAFASAATPIGKPAAVVQPPLRGPGWVAVNGCCDALTSHRGAVMAVNGRLRVPERFAIDWVQLDASGRVFTGDVARLTSYRYYGASVHAVADGVVVNLYDEAGEQTPGAPVKGITTENIGGNMLVVDIGDGAYAFYAHLQRGSLTVKLGDRVVVGQVLGLLGNTGNSTAPHLHFHVMDGPSPLDANGLPYVFSHFTSRGFLSAGVDDALEKGEPATIDATRWSGRRAGQLPLDNQVVDFD